MEDKGTLFEVLQKASIFLDSKTKDNHLARHYWMELFDWSLTDLVLNMQQPVDEEMVHKYESALERVLKDEPIQYIKGYTFFNGKRFKVTPDVLIPREETEGLLDLVKRKRPEDKGYEILDIGTGSGILSVSLALMYPHSQVSATDISPEAMTVAIENQRTHQVEVNNYVTDLVTAIAKDQRFDIIVSNPPYISYEETDLMTANVLKYEPHLALFAENDGLAIYERLAKVLPYRIKENGLILLEIGLHQGEAVRKLFQDAFPKAQVTCHQDFNELDRYIVVELQKEDER